MRQIRSLDERFLEKVRKYKEQDACWEWLGYRYPNNYGGFNYRGTCEWAHRVAWELTHGPIPKSMCVLHHCDNPPCVRPDHLFLGTKGDNLRDMTRKGRHWCKTRPELIKRGENKPQHKLTEAQVREIRTRHIPNIVGSPQLAREYGVDHKLILAIVNRKAWRHLQ